MKQYRQKGAIADLLLIILGLIIAFVMFGYFRDKNLFSLNSLKLGFNPGQSIFNQNGNTNLNTSYSFYGCGIDISSPLVWAEVTDTLDFSGQISGCGWVVQNGFAGTLELFDGKTNESLTGPVNVPVNPDGRFNVKTAIKKTSTSSVGYILFESVDRSQNASFNVYFKK